METKPRQDLRKRTRQYAIRAIRLYSTIPKQTEFQIVGKQFLRAATSVGAHYSEAFRSKSSKDFISKMEGALQELEETSYWLDLLSELKNSDVNEIAAISKETGEFIAMFVAIVRNMKSA